MSSRKDRRMRPQAAPAKPVIASPSVRRLGGLGDALVSNDGHFFKLSLLLDRGESLDLEIPTEHLDALVHVMWQAASQAASAKGVIPDARVALSPPPIPVKNMAVALGAPGCTNLVLPFGTVSMMFELPTPTLADTARELVALSDSLAAEPKGVQ